MTRVDLPHPSLPGHRDAYGHARMPDDHTTAKHISKVEYGRFRNVYLYITEACQLRCGSCYMGDRLERALKMPFETIASNLTAWRQMGGSKLTILGGEPTLHPRYIDTIRLAHDLGYEHVITTSNGLEPAAKKLAKMRPDDFSYVQISMDGGTATTHDAVRGPGKFDITVRTVRELADRGFDTRIICTVNKANQKDCLRLLDFADNAGVTLVKFHVFSVIGRGHGQQEWGMQPPEWLEFCDRLPDQARDHKTRVWYQPTYARSGDMARYQAEGYAGCIGRTLDRISVFPDGRCYVCSFLFDTDLHYATVTPQGLIELNKGPNEFDLFTGALTASACGNCPSNSACTGGCPAEEIVDGQASCTAYPEIEPVCRLWKSMPAN